MGRYTNAVCCSLKIPPLKLSPGVSLRPRCMDEETEDGHDDTDSDLASEERGDDATPEGPKWAKGEYMRVSCAVVPK